MPPATHSARVLGMKPNNVPRTNGDDLREAIVAHVHRYQPRLLTEGQMRTMLGGIRVDVLRAEPTSPAIAGNWMPVGCRFVDDSALPSGGSFADALMPAKA